MVMAAVSRGSISFDEPFRGHDASLNSVSDPIVMLAPSSTMEARGSLGVSRRKTPALRKRPATERSTGPSRPVGSAAGRRDPCQAGGMLVFSLNRLSGSNARLMRDRRWYAGP